MWKATYSERAALAAFTLTEPHLQMLESQLSTLDEAIDEGDFTYAHLILKEMLRSDAHKKLDRTWREPNHSDLAEEITSLGEKFREITLSFPEKIISFDSDLQSESALDLIGLIAINYSYDGLNREIWRLVKENCSPATLVKLLSFPDISVDLHHVADTMHLLLTEAPEIEEGQAWIFLRLMNSKDCNSIPSALWRKIAEGDSISEQSAKMFALIEFLRHHDSDLSSSWPLSMLIKRFHPDVYETLEKALSAKYLDNLPDHSAFEYNLPLYKWVFEQPLEVRELLLERMFIHEVIDLFDVTGMLVNEVVEVPENMGPFFKSIIWLARLIGGLEDEGNWEPKGLYYYVNTIGIVTDLALWEVEMILPSNIGESWGVKVVCNRTDHVGNVCVDTIDPTALPIGDRVLALVLACWNDEETAKRVDTFAEALDLPVPEKVFNHLDEICPNCDEVNIYYEAGGDHENCQCTYIHNCPSCSNWTQTPGECFPCRVDHH